MTALTLSWRRLLYHIIMSYHIETNPFICSANQWTKFYVIGTSVIKKLIVSVVLSSSLRRTNKSFTGVISMNETRLQPQY